MRRVCPTCGRSTADVSDDLQKYLPFCSRRCQLIDLGKWFDEQYRIPIDREQADSNATADAQDEPPPPEAPGS